VVLAVVAVVAIALVAIASEDAPATAAKRFVDAAANLDGLHVSELTCDMKRDEVLASTGLVSGLLLYFEMPALQTTSRELTFTTVASSGEDATVRVSGRLTSAILGFVQSKSIDALFTMRRERGAWRYCGESLPDSTTLAG
jgi:hypothetical protein